MKLLLLSLMATTVISLGAFSQDWNSVIEETNFSVYVAEIEYRNPADGIHHQRLVFKYQNHTAQPLELSFNREVNFGGATITQERNFSVLIPGNGSVAYDEARQHDQTFYLFKKDHEGFISKHLRDFKIINIRTN